MADTDDTSSPQTQLKIEVKLVPELWNLAAGWVNEHLIDESAGGPTTNQVLGAAATLLHVAAMSWSIFEPPPEVAALLSLDEATFVELARDMFKKAQASQAEKKKAGEAAGEGEGGGGGGAEA